MNETPVYLPRPVYRLFAAGGAAVAALFAWDVVREYSLPTLFFLLAATGSAVVYLRWTLMRLELTVDGVTVHAPLQSSRQILYRQIIAFDEAGRIAPGLSLVYWPVSAEGFVEMETPRTLFLPAVARQEELLAALEERIPA
ncbi:MAG: hypothetical protein OXH98_16440 [Caldilineaceae bacterium]|nr:hypothetical protein [Caldilineaceae bacterium]